MNLWGPLAFMNLSSPISSTPKYSVVQGSLKSFARLHGWQYASHTMPENTTY